MNRIGWALDQPPIGSVINWNNSITQGLVSCVVFNGNGGQIVTELARKTIATATNAPVYSVSFKQREMKFVAGSDQYVNLGNPSYLQITGSMTVAISYKLDSAPASLNAYMLVTKDKDSGGRAYTMDVYNSSGASFEGVRFYINGGGVANNIAYENRTPVAGDSRVAFGVYDQTVPELRVYIEGILTGAVSSTADASIPSATANVLIGRREYASFESPLDGRVRFAYIWNRVLSVKEMKDISTAPYHFLKTPRRRMIAPPAAAASSVISNMALMGVG